MKVSRVLQVTALATGIGCSLYLAGDTAAAQGRGVRRGPPPTAGRPPVAGKPADAGPPPVAGRPHDVGDQRRGRGPGREGAGRPEARTEPRDERSFEVLRRNPRLADRVRGLLPPGTDLEAAQSGFRNLGQFIAAVHAANNLGLPFDQIKAKMVSEGLSLGRAIRALKPEVDADAEARRAQAAARETMRGARRP